jgi:excisionase family DNA binding protein
VVARTEDTGLTDLPAVLTVRDVSRILKIGLRQAYELTWQRRLLTIRIGRSVRVTRSALASFMAEAEGEIGR